MPEMTFFRFEPMHKKAVWGGRRLADLLGRDLPPGEPVGESWELVDLPGDQSVVCDGPFRGWTLERLIAERREQVLGSADLLEGRFPLLLKIIDASRTLSVQVHPDEAACARLGGGARPKTEAWYVMSREPGAVLYAGLAPGVDRDRFVRALDEGTVAETLNRVPVEPGDFVFLGSGTVHAIGAGIVLAEVQQSSATTYRVFDWNRVGLDGRPRRLHVAEALESIDFSRPGAPEAGAPASGRRGIACDHFEMEEVDLDRGAAVLEGSGPLVLCAVAGSGRASLSAAGHGADLTLGRTLLVPACIAASVEASGRDLVLLAARATSRGR